MFKKYILALVLVLLGVVSVAKASGNKVYVCHVTSSDKNPVVLIDVSVSALQTMLDNGDYLLPEGQFTCEGGDPLPE